MGVSIHWPQKLGHEIDQEGTPRWQLGILSARARPCGDQIDIDFRGIEFSRSPNIKFA